MEKEPTFDLAAAHKYFAAHCFNRAWDLIEKEQRTAEEDRLMLALSQASIYHWLQRPDRTDRNVATGYWQASRVQALIGNAAEAKRYAETCLAFSGGLDPFYVGYGHEALARAALTAGDHGPARLSLAEAGALAARVDDKEDRALLEKDLAQLRSALGAGAGAA